MDWLRWWHGTVTDPKFQRVARMSGASVGEVLAVWACLLECASSVPECDASVTVRDAERDGRDEGVTKTVRVSRGDVTSFDCDDHDVLLGFGDGKTAAVVAALTDRGLIVGGRLASWDERQPLLRDSAGRRQSSSAARSAAYRARKKAAQQSSQNERDESVTRDGSDVTRDESHAEVTPDKTREDKSNTPFSPPGDVSPEQPAKAPAKKPAAKGVRAKPKKPLPLPFLITEDMLAWAKEKTPAVNIDRETEGFIDYWKGTGESKADWPATWRNRMRRMQDDLERRGLAKPVKKDPNDTSWIEEDDGV
ncbi:hypothetical protein CO724_17395 [Ectopseudomonas mendocina]|nr:hypothetical protein CO724_17395 [Pseudomonas mendocina]